MRDQVFICYSKQDSKWLEALQKHMKPLLRLKLLPIWDENKIKPGQERLDEIKHAIALAKVAVLLVTPDFLASDFIAEQQLPTLLNAAENDGLTILWIAIRTSSYQATEIERYEPLNDPSKPLAAMTSYRRDKELTRICEQIASAAEHDLKSKEIDKPEPPLVIHTDVVEMSLQDERIASPAEIQRLLELHFDVDACFIRQKELKSLFDTVRLGHSAMIQGVHGVGKTALLKQLQTVCQHEHISFRCIDLSIIDAQFETTLWQNIVMALTYNNPGVIKPDEVEHYLESATLVPQAAICLDNIDAFASNPRISLEYEMLQLRALGTHHASALKLSIILTSHPGFNMEDYHLTTGSPWFTNYPITKFAALSEQRAIYLLNKAGIIDNKQLAFCINKAKYLLPLDLLLLAYLLNKATTVSGTNYELAESVYLHLEPLLRK